MRNKEYILRDYISSVLLEESLKYKNEGLIKDFVKNKAAIALMTLPGLLANIGSSYADTTSTNNKQQTSQQKHEQNQPSASEMRELEELFEFIDSKYGDYDNIKTQSDLNSEFEIVKGYFYEIASKKGYSKHSIEYFLSNMLETLLVKGKHLENYETGERKITQSTSYIGTDEFIEDLNNIISNNKYKDIRDSLETNFKKNADKFRNMLEKVNNKNIDKLTRLIKINFNFFTKYNLNNDQLFAFILVVFNEDPSYEKVIKRSMSGSSSIHTSNIYKHSLDKLISVFATKGFKNKDLERVTKEILKDNKMKEQLINYLAIVKCLTNNKSNHRGEFLKLASEAAKKVVRFDGIGSGTKGKGRGKK